MTDPANARNEARTPPRISLALLVLIAFSGTLAMHIFVPALPAAAEALATDTATIQLAVTVYIFGLAIGQLLYGPLSDAFGRRPAVLAGLALYFVGSVACYFASNIETLLAVRFLQALGGAGGLALTRVIVADTSKGAAATRGIAILNMILLVGPGTAPIFGAEISELFGWRTIFLLLSLMGISAIIFTIFRLPETGSPSGNFSLKKVGGDLVGLARNGRFLRVATGGAAGSTACYGYFVSAPFILHTEMGLSVQAVGYCVGSTLAAAAAGSMLTRSIVGKLPDRMLMLTFSMLGVLAGGIFLAGALGHWLNPALVVGLSCFILFVAGALGPLTISNSLRDAGAQAASASGIYGSLQMMVGVLCSLVAGLFSDHAFGCGLILFGAYAFCWLQFYLRRG